MTRALIVVAGIAALFTLASSVTLVQPGERAVVSSFGQILPDNPEPGLLLTLPWGMDKVDRVKVGMERSITIGWTGKEGDEGDSVSQFLTGDHNLVNVKAEIRFRVVENEVDRFVIQGEGQVESLIARSAESALAEWLAQNRVETAILQGKHLLPLWLVARVRERIAPYRLGVQIEGASIPVVSPPSEVSSDFDAVGQEHTRIQTQKYRAEQEADRKLRDAQAQKFRIESAAAAEADELKLAAQGDAEVFGKRLRQYRKLKGENPDYLNVLWLYEMTRLYERIREAGRLDLLDHYLGADGLNITQFPLPAKKK